MERGTHAAQRHPAAQVGRWARQVPDDLAPPSRPGLGCQGGMAHVKPLGRFVDKVLPKNERLASVRALLLPLTQVTSTAAPKVSNVCASTGLRTLRDEIK